MPPRSQPVSEVLATGLSVPTRTILLCDDVDDAMVKLVWTSLQVLDREDSTITFDLCSAGGYVNAGFAIYDMLRAAKAHIRIVGMGRIYSMGVIILQAGDERLLLPNASLMMHPASGEIKESNLVVAAQELGEYQRGERRTVQVLADSMGLSEAQYRERYGHGNYYLSAEQAVDVGLADRILID